MWSRVDLLLKIYTKVIQNCNFQHFFVELKQTAPTRFRTISKTQLTTYNCQPFGGTNNSCLDEGHMQLFG